MLSLHFVVYLSYSIAESIIQHQKQYLAVGKPLYFIEPIFNEVNKNILIYFHRKAFILKVSINIIKQILYILFKRQIIIFQYS
jgi:hypothetical protein